jgi:hypothetical protein
MANVQRSNTSDSSTDGSDASARSQQELYGRPEPTDLDEGRIGRDDPTDVEDPDPGQGTDGSGEPSTARAGANTQ